MNERARYLYGITREVTDSEFAGVSGLGGERLRVVEHDGLSALVTPVDLDEFGEDVLERHLQDLAWLSETAQIHHRVLCEVAARTSVAPLRLATICLDDDSVRGRLAGSASTLHRNLDRIAGRAEWGVKVFADDGEPETSESGEASSPRSGRDYLQQRKAQVEHRRHAAERRSALADEVLTQLSQVCVDVCTLSPHDARISGERATMLLNVACLVETDSPDLFHDGVDRLRLRYPDLRIDCAGPWPVYSFVALEER